MQITIYQLIAMGYFVDRQWICNVLTSVFFIALKKVD